MSTTFDEATRAVLEQMDAWSRKLGEPTPSGTRALAERIAAFRPAPVPEVAWKAGEVDGPAGRIPVRVYRPPAAVAGAVMLYVHGGGWITGRLELMESICQQLARRSGFAVVSAAYRLAPECPYPAPLDDLDAVLDWLRAGGAGVDAGLVAAIGESAGGNLLAGLGIRRRDTGRRGVDLQALVYPALDPTMSSGSYREFATGHGLDAESMRWYWRQYLTGTDSPDPAAAPLTAASLGGLPSTIVLTGALDVLHDEAHDFARRLQLDGTSALVLDYPNMIHGFFSSSGAIPRGMDAIDDLCGLIGRMVARLGAESEPAGSA